MGNKKGNLRKNHKYVDKLCLVCSAQTRNKKFCSNTCRSIGMKGCKGRKHTAKSLALMSIASKAAGAKGAYRWTSENNYSKTHGSGMKGKHTSEETKALLSAARKLNNPGGFKKGYVPSTKGKTKENHPGIARSAIKKKEYYLNGGKPGFGYPCFYADDLGHFVRSLWEANFARLLKFMQIEYQYEPGRFDLGDTIYIPDFYIPDFEVYIEVKGNFLGRGSLDKIESFSKNHSILVLDSIAYHILSNKFSKIILNWGKRGGNKNGSVSANVEASN